MKVRDAPVSKRAHTPASAAAGIEHAIRKLEGRWKLVILFHLFGGKTLRFSDLERAIPGISQKMLTQQLRQLEGDGIVTRVVHAEVPPKVEYHLTAWGQSLCPALDKLLTWAEQQPATLEPSRHHDRRGTVPTIVPETRQNAGLAKQGRNTRDRRRFLPRQIAAARRPQ
jgi:DNA-binding HxlR family transcriptional regulator